MDALKNLATNIPDWLKRLDELNGQIEQRQHELAQISESQPADAASRSIKNRGSTESLRPRNDDDDARPDDPPALERPSATPPPAAEGSTPAQNTAADPQPPPSPAGSNTPSAIQRQTSRVKAAGQARARATLRKRQRTDSVVSAEAAAPKYRSRSMIIVYYDSYVQSFFEELVKFVSSGRNLMRKAKMAAKVAQIKRMAELEMPDIEGEDDDDDAGDTAGQGGEAKASGPEPTKPLTAVSGIEAAKETPAGGASEGQQKSLTTGPDAPLEAASTSVNQKEEPPTLQYMSTRGMLPISRRAHMSMGMPGRPSALSRGMSKMTGELQQDIYDKLDKGLERVQGMCEHAAHQFLRDGDCGEEVSKIQGWLTETRDLADKEMERVKKEEPEALNASEDSASKGRSFRRPNMRHKHLVSSQAKDPAKETAKDTSRESGSGEIEVDEAVEDVDEEMPAPKLMYKSTRMMR